MKLMIAGCSFSAVSQNLPGTSWSELLANQLGWDLQNLARQGCSNGGIRIQIDEIRRQRPDFTIVTPTFWDRIEIPAKAAPYAAGHRRNNLQDHLQNKQLKNGYDRTAGIGNINYGNNSSGMICETIHSLAENHLHAYRSSTIPALTQTALKHYVDSLYDSNWKKQIDEWIIVEGILQMYLEELKFIVSPVLLWGFDPSNQNQWRQAFPLLIPDHYIMLQERESVLPISGQYPFTGQDPGYHSSPEGQIVIAENFFQQIKYHNC